MRYYIAAPAGLASGGPELLHQLCYELTEQGYDAAMLYYNMQENDAAMLYFNMQENDAPDPVHPNYKMYHNRYVLDIDTVDCEDACLIVPEPVCLLMFRQTHHCKKIIWWLSVDFFYEYNTLQDSLMLKDMDVMHLVQCQYARSMLLTIFGVPQERIRYLSDYLRPEFLETARQEAQTIKQNIVVYNPKKGYEITRHLIKTAKERIGTEITFVALERMTPAMVGETLRCAKVYIDFGSHPGKDRIPREAAISGCCVITGKKGSAAYAEDVPIPERYKFEDGIAQAQEILTLIEDMMVNYEEYRKDYEAYCKTIYAEKQKFEEDTRHIFAEIESGQF